MSAVADIEVEVLRRKLDRCEGLLRDAVKFDGGTSENGEDMHAERACCHVLHWHEHTEKCWVPRARAYLSERVTGKEG